MAAPIDLSPAPSDGLPHVVIVGAGFAGLAAAKALGGHPVRVTVIDRQNYHLFQPLLYQVATAGLSPADIAEPIRRILSRHRNVAMLLGEVTGVDPGGRRVLLGESGFVPYDWVILATGATHAYFGHDDWAPFAPGLKTIDDARLIRSGLLTSFELAEASPDPEERARLMTSVVVGGGPTGVEMAGAIAELARFTLARDFRRIDPRRATVLLIEAGPRVLAAFPEDLARYAHDRLQRLGVTVVTGQAVEAVAPDGVLLPGRFVPAGTIVWAAGVAASPAGRWLGAVTDHVGRVRVQPDLTVPGFDGRVFALGDVALAVDERDRPLPGLAQVAKQQGQHVGRALAAHLERGDPIPPFRFHDRGNTAIVGRNAAVFDFGRYHLKGWIAWVLWAIVHVYLLVGFDRRLRVALQWPWRYLTYQSGARLITTDSGPLPVRAPSAGRVRAGDTR
jgi:NADH:ubiquinone reductase (H+-translocating)